jgi:hypothetical protein
MPVAYINRDIITASLIIPAAIALQAPRMSSRNRGIKASETTIAPKIVPRGKRWVLKRSSLRKNNRKRENSIVDAFVANIPI